MIQKPTIIITSLGRTGTKFFAELFKSALPNCTSFHEPDVLGIEKDKGVDDVWRQMQEGGFYNMTVGKLLGQWSLSEVSDARLRQEINDATAHQKLLRQRQAFIQQQIGNLYVESNNGYYGLLDLLSATFTEHRAIYIVRDGRSWVQSWMNWGHLYNKSWLRSQIAHTWPTAAEISSDPYAQQWGTMSRFQRVCWAWRTLNVFALRALQKNPQAKLFYFEQLFQSPSRQQTWEKLLEHVDSLPGGSAIDRALIFSKLDKPIHQSSRSFPAWHEWTLLQRQQFRDICGTLMTDLGYDLE